MSFIDNFLDVKYEKNLHHTCVLTHMLYRQRFIAITESIKPL